VELCKKFGVEILKCGQWLLCEESESLEEAIDLAKSFLSLLDDGNNVRIVCPDGKIL
jgi:hypothetical protein